MHPLPGGQGEDRADGVRRADAAGALGTRSLPAPASAARRGAAAARATPRCPEPTPPQVEQDNEPALRLYEKLGYQEVWRVEGAAATRVRIDAEGSCQMHTAETTLVTMVKKW